MPRFSPAVPSHDQLAGVTIDQHHAQAHDVSQHADVIHIVKAANEDVNNSSTLQNDDDFSFAVLANEVWSLHMAIQATFRLTSDFKFDWSVPSGAAMRISSRLYRADTLEDAIIGDIGDHPFVLGTTTEYLLVINGVIVIGGTAGTAQFQWAQRTAAIENTTLRRESYMIARRS